MANKVFERGQKITEKRYRDWFEGIFAKYPFLERIVIAERVKKTYAHDIFESDWTCTAVVTPGQAILVDGTVSVEVHDFDCLTVDQREEFRRHLIRCGTNLSPGYARTQQERLVLGDERGREDEIYR